MLKLAEVPGQKRVRRLARRKAATALRPQHLYFAFMSYSHRDEAAAAWLHCELERFRVPRALAGRLTASGVIPKRLTPVFRDRHELAAAEDLAEEIREALESSRFLIVLCSPDAAKSHWTNAEIELFKRIRPDADVLAVILSGEPFASDAPGRETEECFPPALREKFDRRGRPTGKRAEPLAADLRESGDGKRTGFLKLVAGMLGVGLDDLVQRETTQRHRRMAWLAAASLSGMAITSGLAITAIQARDSAREQRRQAEGLVAFMLGDLKDKLEPIGRLDALDGVGSRVLAYYSKQDTSELTDAALLQRAQALSLTAQVAYLRGDMAGAERLYREAMEGTGEAVERSPDEPQRLFDHAQNVFQIAELARNRGQAREAEAAYREYKRLADRMAAIEPDNLKWRMEVQYARENLGIVLYSQRRYEEAARMFEGSLRPMQMLAALDPNNVEYQKEASNALAWLAQSQWVLGRFDTAIALRQQQIAYLEAHLKGGSTDVLVREKLIPARQGLGLLFTARGEPDRGAAEFRQALVEANRLIAIEPGNNSWRDLGATVKLELAKNLLAMGQREAAAREVTAGCESAAALRDRDPSLPRWRALRTNCLDRRTRLALAAGAMDQALALAQQTVAAAQTEKSDDSVTDHFRVAAAYRLLGDIRRRSNDPAGAKAAWEAGLAQLPANAVERPWEINERAELLRRLGRPDEARPLAERLAAMKFRSVN